MKYKVGQVLYEAVGDADTGEVTTDEWKVSAVRDGVVHCIMVCALTWGKRSKKHGDFGWLPNIPKWLKHSFPEKKGSRRAFTTKRQAYVDELAFVKKGWLSDDEAINAKLTKTLNTLIARCKKKKAAPKCKAWPACGCIMQGRAGTDCKPLAT